MWAVRILVVTAALLASGSAWAQFSGGARTGADGQTSGDVRGSESFRQGRVRVSGNVAATFYQDVAGFQATVGAGYLVLDGLDLGLDLGFDYSSITSAGFISPNVRYIINLHPEFQPYVGAFYRRWFSFDKDASGYDTAGARAGAYYTTDVGVSAGIGFVYERVFVSNCDSSCNRFYPEATVSYSF